MYYSRKWGEGEEEAFFTKGVLLIGGKGAFY